MSQIDANFGSGGANLTEKGHGSPALATALRDVATDLANLRAAFVALTAKIDADATDTGGDDDYADTVDPPALLTTQG
jgi:hypothetical protein